MSYLITWRLTPSEASRTRRFVAAAVINRGFACTSQELHREIAVWAMGPDADVKRLTTVSQYERDAAEILKQDLMRRGYADGNKLRMERHAA